MSSVVMGSVVFLPPRMPLPAVQRSPHASRASVTFPHMLIGEDLLVRRDERELVKPGGRHQEPIGGGLY